MPTISVLIPTYNRAAKLERCLNSVVACSLPDIEILVADNASPDETQRVIQSFHDPRLRSWRNESNIGPERNVLDLMDAARGTWIFFLTDDDLLLPGALESLSSILQANPRAGAVLSNLKQTREGGAPLPDYRTCERGGYFEPGREALLHFVKAAHILSRITLRREWIDLPGSRRQIGTMYPQMYSIGSIVKKYPGFYLDDCLVQHTVGNEVFWNYTPDFMIGARIRLFQDLLPGWKWRSERRALIDQLIDAIQHAPFLNAWKSGKWLALQRELIRSAQIRYSLRYWRAVGKFLLQNAFVKKKKSKKKSRAFHLKEVVPGANIGRNS